jgi:hypothetical protein
LFKLAVKKYKYMQTLIAIMASLSIPSLALSIFLFIQDRKYKKWQAEKDLKLKKIELEEVVSEDNFYILADSGNMEKYKKRDRDIEKINAEIDYLRKIAGKQQFFDFKQGKNLWQKIKSWIKY